MVRLQNKHYISMTWRAWPWKITPGFTFINRSAFLIILNKYDNNLRKHQWVLRTTVWPWSLIMLPKIGILYSLGQTTLTLFSDCNIKKWVKQWAENVLHNDSWPWPWPHDPKINHDKLIINSLGATIVLGLASQRGQKILSGYHTQYKELQSDLDLWPRDRPENQ